MAVLKQVGERFDQIYGEDGRHSIPPERLLRALLVQMLYTVHSERMLMEQLEYNLLFRWFVGISASEPVWHPTVFSKNRDRLLEGAVAEEFFSQIVAQARAKKLLSNEHFTVDGTLIEAWAGQKRFQLTNKENGKPDPPSPDAGRNQTVNFHKQDRRNDPHRSMTDRQALLYRKGRGRESKLVFVGQCRTSARRRAFSVPDRWAFSYHPSSVFIKSGAPCRAIFKVFSPLTRSPNFM